MAGDLKVHAIGSPDFEKVMQSCFSISSGRVGNPRFRDIRTGTVAMTNFADLLGHQRTILQVSDADAEISMFVQEVQDEVGE